MSVCDIVFDHGRESLMECLNVIYITFVVNDNYGCPMMMMKCTIIVIIHFLQKMQHQDRYHMSLHLLCSRSTAIG